MGLWALTLATALPLTYGMTLSVAPYELNLFDAAVLGLFFVLTTWIALWFWIATAGFWQAWRRTPEHRFPYASSNGDTSPLTKTAILLPVYNEDPTAVFARIRAMLKSLESIRRQGAFDFFVLSDTTNPDIWLQEEWHWLRLQQELSRPTAVYYRRRSKNEHRKAGNIEDFCERWGASYRLMVVLDADSLLDGEVLVELVRRMEADPKLGLLQTPTLPLGDRSLLSRCQQFAAKLCCPLLAEGLDFFSGDGGNYWGHNAIIRTTAFTRHCGLSDLPGAPPLGGEILSHDFVEAALMQRAGYKVCLASDLTASYEQSPTTLPEFAQRDQRWCQGNLQHTRLVVSRRIPLSNRFHFATGVMAFVSSPLWLTFLLLGALAWLVDPAESSTAHGDEWVEIHGWLAAGVFALVMLMLLAPRVWGAILAAQAPSGLAGYGGEDRLVGSLLLEFLVSVLLAPIMMAFHTLFVVSTLFGRRVEWSSQNRSDAGVSFRQAWQVHRGQMFAGIVATIIVATLMPKALLWLSPVLFGLVFSIPISMAVSSARLGSWFKQRRLLLVPEEIERPAIVHRFERELTQTESLGGPAKSDVFRQLLRDPNWLRSHLATLQATSETARAPRRMVRKVAARITNSEWASLTDGQKRTILSDPAALDVLHRYVWRIQAPQLAAETARPLSPA